jgi:hypothetical protein
MKNMKQKLLSVIVVLALTLGPCTVSMASETANATRNSMKSAGNVIYTDGDNTVEIYSDDLYSIADKLDSFKTSIASQMAAIHTYFSAGNSGQSTVTNNHVRIVHKEPAAVDSIDPLTMDFDTLLEGLAASQSIPTDVTEYGYPSGQKLYKTSSGSLTTSSSGATQINIAAATASNLSAGTAAWVSGNLILGTGGDHAAYYNSGYNKGYQSGYSSGYSYGYSDGVSSSSGSGSITFCGKVDKKTNSVTLSSDCTYFMTFFRYGAANVSTTPESIDLSDYITGDYTTIYNQRLTAIEGASDHRSHAVYSVVIQTTSSCTIGVSGTWPHCAHIYQVG